MSQSVFCCQRFPPEVGKCQAWFPRGQNQPHDQAVTTFQVHIVLEFRFLTESPRYSLSVKGNIKCSLRGQPTASDSVLWPIIYGFCLSIRNEGTNATPDSFH